MYQNDSKVILLEEKEGEKMAQLWGLLKKRCIKMIHLNIILFLCFNLFIYGIMNYKSWHGLCNIGNENKKNIRRP